MWKKLEIVLLQVAINLALTNRAKQRFQSSLAKRLTVRNKSDGIIASETVSSFQRRATPHITVVSMFRNEKNRAHDIMRHFCALFDRIVVIDHLSTDATADIVNGYDGMNGTQVFVLRGEDPGYYQSEYMSEVANALLAEGKTDWIFFLDADEFLPYLDVASFRQALVEVTSEPIIHGHWHNLAVVETEEGTVQRAKCIIGPTVSNYVKIALNARLVKSKVVVDQGNHAVRLDGRNFSEIGSRAFGLWHVPILNNETFHSKIAQGTKALENTLGRPKILGSHWRDLDENIDKLMLDNNLMHEVALQYGRPLLEIIDCVASGKCVQPTRNFELKFAQTPVAAPIKVGVAPSFNLLSAAEVISKQFEPQSQNSLINDQLNSGYLQLLDRPNRPTLEYRSKIDDAIMAASTNVEVLVPSAWSNHIPFLYTLMEMQRPQRYVELGTHMGASFFAACQHIRSNGNYGEAVAIDIWAGDHQAGFYSNQVFIDFERQLNSRFPKTGKFIRSYFSEAASSFEDRSIELLHIDGLHTYEAVKEDYETWRPKLTDNGVMIFHDTNEFQTDFGVNQLFGEIRHQATTSFEFRHGHGLGVMAFGTRETNPVIELLNYFATRPEKIESYYETLGRALWSDARLRHG